MKGAMAAGSLALLGVGFTVAATQVMDPTRTGGEVLGQVTLGVILASIVAGFGARRPRTALLFAWALVRVPAWLVLVHYSSMIGGGWGVVAPIGAVVLFIGAEILLGLRTFRRWTAELLPTP